MEIPTELVASFLPWFMPKLTDTHTSQIERTFRT